MKLCECGCGEPTPLSKYNDRRDGVVKGQPMRFINHHHPRKTVTTAYLMERIEPVTESGCWIWMGEIAKSHGYGIVNGKQLDGSKRRQYAHRVFYERFKEKIPEMFTIDHLCRVHCCVNPDHLEAVTRGENVLRGCGVAAIHARKTHCSNGHPFTPENTYLAKRKYGLNRQCRTCRTERVIKSKIARILCNARAVGV